MYNVGGSQCFRIVCCRMWVFVDWSCVSVISMITWYNTLAHSVQRERERERYAKKEGRLKIRRKRLREREKLVTNWCFLQVNEEFVNLLSEAYFVTKHNVDSAESMLRSALMEPRTAGKTIDVEHENWVVIKCLKMVCKWLSIYHNFRMGGGADQFQVLLQLALPPYLATAWTFIM
jgi:hypothetical protein